MPRPSPIALHVLIQLLLNEVTTYIVTIYIKGNRKEKGYNSQGQTAGKQWGQNPKPIWL